MGFSYIGCCFHGIAQGSCSQWLLIARCMCVHVFEVLGLGGAAQYLKPPGNVLNK